jgi:hypothetical protein
MIAMGLPRPPTASIVSAQRIKAMNIERGADAFRTVSSLKVCIFRPLSLSTFLPLAALASALKRATDRVMCACETFIVYLWLHNLNAPRGAE